MATDADATKKTPPTPEPSEGEAESAAPRRRARTPRKTEAAAGASRSSGRAKAPKAKPEPGKGSGRRPRRGTAQPAEPAAAAAPEEATPNPAPGASSGDPGLIVSGEQIRHDGAEAILHRVDVGPEPKETILEGADIRNDSTETILQGPEIMSELPPAEEALAPILVTVEEALETILEEAPMAPVVYDEAAALADAGLIVDMLNGLAEASAQASGEAPEASAPDAVALEWYSLAHRIEEAERAVAQRRRSGGCARKLARQYTRAAEILHDLVEAAVREPDLLRRHERPIARLLALLEVEVPGQAKVQKAYAEVLRAERRALARARKAEASPHA